MHRDSLKVFRANKRNKQRTKMVVPIHVRLAETKGPLQPAHTLDATEKGIMFAGYRGELKVNDTVEIQHRHERALFRVVWIRLLEKSSEKHVGAESVSRKNIWGRGFPHKTNEEHE